MPNRLVREGFLDSEAVNSLSPAAECLYFRLLLIADDAGRADGRVEMIKSKAFPLKHDLALATLKEWLDEVVRAGLVHTYMVDGKWYLQVMRWQRAGNAVTSRFPGPDGSYKIEYVQRGTRDGMKDFVTTSMPSVSHADGIATPSASHPNANEVRIPSASHQHPIVGDVNRIATETETKGVGVVKRHSDTNGDSKPKPTPPPPSNSVFKTPDNAPPSQEVGREKKIAPAQNVCNCGPTFEPVKRGLYPREYDNLIETAQAEIKRIKDDPASWDEQMTKEARELHDLLLKEGKPLRAEEVKRRQGSYQRVLRPSAAITIQAWQKRIDELKRAKAGVL